MSKISIIGAGNVGAAVAHTLVTEHIATEIVLIDINKEKALGEAMDVYQGTPYTFDCKITAGDYPDAVGSDIVIVSSGIGRKPGQSRLDLAQVNYNLTKDQIIPEITKYAPDAIYVIVGNPVDVITYTFCKHSGLPESHIIGSGTLLDTSRLRARLSSDLNVSQQNVHAHVFGEHGDSSFIPWSTANIAGVPLSQYAPDIDHEEITTFVKKSGSVVISRKGATFYAVADTTAYICKSILTDAGVAIPVSAMMNGEYGISDVCLSVLNFVGRKGATGKLLLPMNDEEIALLNESANALKETINSLK